MKSLLIAICVLLFALPAQADTMTEMHDCIQDCLGSYSDLSWDFYLCVRDCLKKWDAQKGDINVAVAPSSSGYGRLLGLPFVFASTARMASTERPAHRQRTTASSMASSPWSANPSAAP